MKEFFRHLADALTPIPPLTPARKVKPRYFTTPNLGALDATQLHSYVTQAKAGNLTPLLSHYREIETSDDAIQSSLNSRKLAVLSDLPTVSPCRRGNVDDLRAADLFRAALDNSPTYLDGVKHWLSGTLWPVAVNSIRWLPSRLDYGAFTLTPVPLEQLDYSMDYTLRIAQVSDDGAPLYGQSEYADPAKYIVHRGHLSSHSDLWGGPFRSLIFWHLFGACDRDWFVRFLERFGAPFMVGKYDPDDEESRANLEIAFSQAAQTFGIVATSDTSVDLHEAKSAVGSNAFEAFHNIAERAKIRVILGQTLSAKSDATGLGSGNAGLQGDVRSEYRSWDRLMLCATIRRGLIEPFMRINRLPGEPPKISFPGDPADLAKIGSFLQTAAAAGLELDDEGLLALNDQTGLGLRRAGTTLANAHQTAPPNLATLLAASQIPPGVVATGALSRGATADILRALRRDHGPVSQILATSTNLDGLMSALEAHFATVRPSTPETLARVVTTAAANALGN